MHVEVKCKNSLGIPHIMYQNVKCHLKMSNQILDIGVFMLLPNMLSLHYVRSRDLNYFIWTLGKNKLGKRHFAITGVE